MEYRLLEILDIEKISQLLKSYTKATGLVSALLDLEGNILAKSGWQKICTDFHRVHPEAAKNCRKSDTILANKLNEGGEFNVYKCLNGLIDVAVPIKLNNQHIGNLFTGQFFFEKPSEIFFRKQAQKYNFEESSYLSNLAEVPILNESDIKNKLDFLIQMTEVIAELGYAKMVEIESKEALFKSQNKYKDLFENMNEGFALHEIITDKKNNPIDYRYLEVNPAFEKITGLKSKQIIGKTLKEVLPGTEKDSANWIGKYGEVALTGKNISFEDYSESLKKWYSVHCFSPQKRRFAVTFSDITERKRAEEINQEVEAKFKEVFHTSPTAYTIFDTQGKLIEVNRSFCQMTGFSEREIVGKTTLELGLISDSEQQRMLKIDHAEGGTFDNFELKMKKRDGSDFYILLSRRNITINGKIYGLGSAIDINQRKQTEGLLRKSEARFKLMFENAIVGTVINQLIRDGSGKAIDFLHLDANPATKNHLGATPDQIIGFRASQLVSKAETKYMVNLNEKVVNTGTPYNIRRYYKEFDKTIDLSAFHIEEDIFVSTFFDVSEKMRSEEKLRESEVKFRTLLEHSIQGILLIQEGEVTYVNKAQLKITGLSYEETMKLSLAQHFELLHPDDRQSAIDRQARFDQGEEVDETNEIRIIHKDGNIRWVLASTVTFTLFGKPARMGLMVDITERKLADEQLAATTAKLSAALRSMSDAVFISDTEGNFIHFNHAFASFHKFKNMDECEKTFAAYPDILDVLSLEGKPVPTENWAVPRALRGEIGTRVEFMLRRKDTNESWIGSYNYAPIRDENGNIVGSVVTARDITKRKQHEKEIRQLNRELEYRVKERTFQLEAANKELEAFSYSISHDLRAPLRAINGYSNFLFEDYSDKLDDEAQRFIATIQQNATKMDNLISDLLNFSRVSKSSIKLIEADMKSIALSMYYEVATEEEKEKFKLKIDEMPLSSFDVTLIKQVWQNLIGNALKYSSKSNVKQIEISAIENENEIIYSIKDYGAGFNEKYKGKLFGVFQRLHSMEDFEGTGIGLAIVQRIIFRHGGRVGAEGKVNKGATFYFTLPKNIENQIT